MRLPEEMVIIAMAEEMAILTRLWLVKSMAFPARKETETAASTTSS